MQAVREKRDEITTETREDWQLYSSMILFAMIMTSVKLENKTFYVVLEKWSSFIRVRQLTHLQ